MTPTTAPPPSRTRRAPGPSALLLGLVLVLAGCGSSGTEDEPGVATLDQAASTDPDAGASAGAQDPDDAEEELLAYVECLRGEGLDVPDPTVDGEGNLTLGGPGAAGGDDGAGAPGAGIDAEAFDAAVEVCGDVPEGAVAGFDDLGSAEFEDAALAFAGCMREAGFDVPDPDLDGGLPAAGDGAASPLGNLDTEDPAVAAALEDCQQVFTDAGVGQP